MKTTRLIGLKCKRGDTFSLQILIGRGLFLLIHVKKFSLRYFCFSFSGKNKIVGVNSDEDTPVPIPNTEVKLINVDDTWLATPRESRTMPAQ